MSTESMSTEVDRLEGEFGQAKERFEEVWAEVLAIEERVRDAAADGRWEDFREAKARRDDLPFYQHHAALAAADAELALVRERIVLAEEEMEMVRGRYDELDAKLGALTRGELREYRREGGVVLNIVHRIRDLRERERFLLARRSAALGFLQELPVPADFARDRGAGVGG